MIAIAVRPSTPPVHGPIPVFDGTRIGPDFGKRHLAPFTGYQSSHSYFPPGTTEANSTGVEAGPIPGETGTWIKLWTVDNGHYGVNAATVPHNATIRSQITTPPNPGGALDPGDTVWIVARSRHTIPPERILKPTVEGGPLNGHRTAGLFADRGLESIYGPPFAGSNGGSTTLDAAGNLFRKCDRTTTVGEWRYPFPVGTTVTTARKIHLSSAHNVADGWSEIYASTGHRPLRRQSIRLANGGTTRRITGICTLTDANYQGPQRIGIGNYHRYGMYTGRTEADVQGPWIYRAGDVTDVKQIDPYYREIRDPASGDGGS